MDTNYVFLVIGAKLGQTKDFGCLVSLFQDKLFSYVKRFVYDPSDAQEVAQESFVCAWERINGLKRAEAFPAWLWQIARHKALAYLHERTLCRIQTDEGVGDRPDSRSYEDKEEPDWEDLTRSLQPDQKALIDLRYRAGFSLGEIGHITNVSEKCIKSRLYEIRQKLKKQFDLLSPPMMTGRNSSPVLKEKVMNKIDSLRLGAEVMERLAHTNQISLTLAAFQETSFSADLLAAIGETTRGKEFLSLYGGRITLNELIGILNHVDRHTEARIINELDQSQPTISEAIKARLFVFEDLILFDRTAIRLLMTETDKDILATALAGTVRETRTHFLDSLEAPDRADLQERISSADAGATRIKAAEEEVIRQIQEMERNGRLLFQRKGEGDVIITVPI